MEKYIIAIDQGTTSSRTIIYDKHQNAVASAQREFPQHFPQPGWVNHDANDIWLSVLATISEAVIAAGIQPEQVEAIGITNQRETTILWDRKTGQPVCPAIVWQSRQSDEICRRYKDMGKEDLIRQKTGLLLDPYFSATKLVWMFEQNPTLKERADKGELMFGTVDSWLAYNLSGQKIHVTDITNASRTLLYNIHTLQWDEELLELFGIPASILPEVRSNSEIYGYTAPYHFFGQEIPIAGMIGDQQAALFGQNCFEAGAAKNTYGTGGFLLMNTGEKPIHSRHGLVSTIAWKRNDTVNYALEGSIFVCGSLIQWLRDGLHILENAAQSETLASQVDDAAGVVIVPAFTGLGAPYWDDQTRGTILGLTRGTNRSHIARAALEAMAHQSADLVQAMENDTGIEIGTLLVDGGAVANNLLLQIQADLLQKPVCRPKRLESTALGAARMAGLAVGYWTMDDFVQEPEREFVPHMKEEDQTEARKTWASAVKAARSYEH